MVCEGLKKHLASYRNRFDAVIVLASLVTVALLYIPNGFDDQRVVQCVVALRLFRLTRLLYRVRQFRVFSTTFVRVLPAAAKLGQLLFCNFFIFGTIGMQIFGGLINNDPESPYYFNRLKGSAFDKDGYYSCNFNDLLSAFGALFLLMIEFDSETLEGFDLVTSRWARIYFGIFYIIGVLLTLNIVVAFILDTFIVAVYTNSSGDEKESGRNTRPEGRAAGRPGDDGGDGDDNDDIDDETSDGLSDVEVPPSTVFGYQPVPEWMGLDEVPGGRHLTTTIDLGPSLSGSGRGALGGGFVVGGVYRAELPSGYEFT